MAARLQHGTVPASCVTSTGMPAQNAATISNLSCPIPTQPFLPMVQHVDDWVAAFPRSQHFPHPSHKFLYRYSTSLLSFLPLHARELGSVNEVVPNQNTIDWFIFIVLQKEKNRNNMPNYFLPYSLSWIVEEPVGEWKTELSNDYVTGKTFFLYVWVKVTTCKTFLFYNVSEIAHGVCILRWMFAMW